MYKKVFAILCLSVLALSAHALTVPNFGGEIPWPLSNQHIVTVKNSTGLWKLTNKAGDRMFNVEMKFDSRSGFEWIRVAELDPKTYQVISWGEGFFNPSSNKLETSGSSFTDVTFEKGGDLDRLGRYINMFPNGDLNSRPYLLRMVEVETSLGNVLGLSVIEFVNKRFDHYLGTRIFNEPLGCTEVVSKQRDLNCYLPSIPH